MPRTRDHIGKVCISGTTAIGRKAVIGGIIEFEFLEDRLAGSDLSHILLKVPKRLAKR